MREPFDVVHHNIKFVAMQNEQSLTIGGFVDRFLENFHATKVHAHIIAEKFVMIARHIDHPRALPDFAHEFLHHIIMRLRPVPP